MNPRLEMDITFGRLGIDITFPRQNIDIKLKELELTNTPSRFKIEKEPIKLSIDTRESRADFGIYTREGLTKKQRDESIRAGLESIARMARDGDELAQIEKGGNLVDQAVRNSTSHKEINVDIAPKRRPRIEIEEAKIKIDHIPSDTRVSLKDRLQQIYLERGSVDTYLKVKPRVDIRLVSD